METQFKTGSIKPFLIQIFREKFNEYLSYEKFAEHNGITVSEAKYLVKQGRKYHDREVRRQKEIAKFKAKQLKKGD